jgi:uncharacterized protein YmfQ (DUF2313 family)
MGRSALQYRKQLQSLLPKGKLWNRNEDSLLTKVLYGMAEELSRVEERIENLILEKLLNSTNELLTEHETDFGLPEENEDLQPTTELRRRELKSKLLEVGQQDKMYFDDICLAFSYDVWIEEFKPAWCGVMVSGDPCGNQTNIFYWKIHINIDSIVVPVLTSFNIAFDTGFQNLVNNYSANETILVDLTKIIAKINKLKPAHTHVLFDFYDAGFDRGFGRGFRRFFHYDNYWVGLGFDSIFSNGFENTFDYSGVNFKGAFGYGFSIDFDRDSGGGFAPCCFEKTGFKHPA